MDLYHQKFGCDDIGEMKVGGLADDTTKALADLLRKLSRRKGLIREP